MAGRRRRPRRRVLFRDLLARYGALFAGEKSPATLAREAVYLRSKALRHFGRRRVDEVRPEDVERFLTERAFADGTGPATRNRLRAMLSALFRKAVRLGLARRNPCAGIPVLREALRDVPVLPPAEQERLVAAVEGPAADLVTLALDTGLRAGELLALQWRDVDFGEGMVRVRHSKNRRPRAVPFTARGRRALLAARARAGAGAEPGREEGVFAGLAARRTSGEPCLSSRARRAWEEGRKRAGFPELRFHDLRHVYAVTAVRAGVPLGDLKELLGHSSLPMVLRYARHVPQDAAESARRRIEAYLGSYAPGA